MLLVAFLLSLGPSTAAAAESLEGRRVATVEFVPGGQPFPADELSDLLSVRAGAPYSAEAVRQSLQRLYATGRYADIQVDAELVAQGVAIKFLTTENSFIGHVAVEGSPEPPSTGQLVTATKLQLGAEFAPNDLRQAIENIHTRLRANGLYQADVTSFTERDNEIGQINIDFTIAPGKRAKFAGLEVIGKPERPLASVISSTRWRRPLGLFGWRPVTENRLQNGLENIRSYYQKHDRLLAHVSLSNLKYDEKTNTVIPSVQVDAGPLVAVRTSGARVSKGRLRQLIPIYQERSVDRSLLVEGQRNLIEHFQSQGYFAASVEFEQSPGAQAGEELIEYRIDRQDRHRLAAINIAGNRYFNRETLRERMFIMPASLLRFRRGRFSENYLTRDRETIEDLYRSNGFRDVRVETSIQDGYQGKPGALAVGIQVNEGPQWLVSALELEGVDDSDREYLMSVLHSTPGQPYSEFNVVNDRDAVLSYYYNNGYPSATFDWTQTPAENQRVALKFTVHPGPREFVRKVVVNGLATTRPGLVDERIDFGAGDPISQVRIADVQRKLYDLGIFAKVQPAIQNRDGQEASKYVLYQIEEARRYSVNAAVGAELARIGGGITTFDAPAGAAGFAPRVSFGVSRLNVLGLGHTVSLQTRFSTLQQRAVLSYLAPQFQGNQKLSLTFSALYDDSRDVRTFAARRLEGSIQLGQRLSRANSFQYRFSYRDVYVDPNSVKINEQLIPILSQSVRVGQFSTSFITDRRDDPTDAHRGYYQTIDFGYAAKTFGSETEFARLVLRNSSYHRLSRELILARSTQVGFIHRLGGLSAIPLPERFFSGGAYSQRAFPDNQAGPRDPITGFPLGGTAVLMNTVELRFPLIGDNVGGVLFHDAGNVYSSPSAISARFRQRNMQDFDYMVHGVGFGIRYRTPVGPIRVDFSVSPNSPRFFGFEGSRDSLLTCSAPGSASACPSIAQRISIFQFHFSLGQAF